MRPIDADALIETWRKRACEDCDKRKGWKNGKTVGFIYDIGEAPCRACWVDDMLGELEDAPTVNEWISVEEGLPIDGNWVVALLWGLVGFNIGIMAYDATKRNFYDEDGIEYDIDDVAYWVGLPEPPEEEVRG